MLCPDKTRHEEGEWRPCQMRTERRAREGAPFSTDGCTTFHTPKEAAAMAVPHFPEAKVLL